MGPLDADNAVPAPESLAGALEGDALDVPTGWQRETEPSGVAAQARDVLLQSLDASGADFRGRIRTDGH